MVHDDDGAAGVGRTVLTYRAEEDADDLPMPPGADDQEVGILCRCHQYLCRVPFGHDGRDLNTGVLAGDLLDNPAEGSVIKGPRPNSVGRGMPNW